MVTDSEGCWAKGLEVSALQKSRQAYAGRRDEYQNVSEAWESDEGKAGRWRLRQVLQL